jgi:hypothetical protein
MIAMSVSGCGDEESPPVGGGETPSPSVPVQRTTDSGLPEVVSAAPQPDPVAGTLGSTVTVTGKNLFGTESATVEMMLSKPRVLTEVKTANGVSIKPKQGAFVVFDLVIEGVDGTYQFNPQHFHFIPASEVPTWQNKPNYSLDKTTDTPTPIDELKSVSVGSISPGDRLSGGLVFDQPKAALTGGAVVLRALLLVEGRPSAYWLLG